MKFAVIAPVSGLDRYAARSRIHLVLAQYLEISEYRDFYTRMRARGDEIILDNGSYEGVEPVEDEVLWHWAVYLKPTVIVLPDFLLREPRITVSASLRFLDKYVDQVTWGCQWMYVPQAEALDRAGWINALMAVLADARVGCYVGWVGLPRALATHFNGWRVQAA